MQWTLIVLAACVVPTPEPQQPPPPPPPQSPTPLPKAPPPAPPGLAPSPCDRPIAIHAITTSGAPAVATDSSGYIYASSIADRVVFAQGTSEGFVVDIYDPTADRWKHVEAALAHTDAAYWRAAAVGDYLVVEHTFTPHLLWAVHVPSAALRPMPIAGAPVNATIQPLAAAGSLLVWDTSGAAASVDYARGSRFDFASWTWRPLPSAGAPSARASASVALQGDRVFVWGGRSAGGVLADGALLDPIRNAWLPIAFENAPPPLADATVIAWAGKVALWDDGPQTGLRPEPVPRSSAVYVYEPSGRWHVVRYPGVPAADQRGRVRGPYMLVTQLDRTGRFVDIDATGAVFDADAERWTEMPRGPSVPSGTPPLPLGDAALGYFSGAGLVVADLAAARWCTAAIDHSKLPPADRMATSWGGQGSAGAWGALRIGTFSSCSAPAPCARVQVTPTTGTPTGYVLTW